MCTYRRCFEGPLRLAMRNAGLREEGCTKRRRWWDQWREDENAGWYVERRQKLLLFMGYTFCESFFGQLLPAHEHNWNFIVLRSRVWNGGWERKMGFVCDFLDILFKSRTDEDYGLCGLCMAKCLLPWMENIAIYSLRIYSKRRQLKLWVMSTKLSGTLGIVMLSHANSWCGSTIQVTMYVCMYKYSAMVRRDIHGYWEVE